MAKSKTEVKSVKNRVLEKLIEEFPDWYRQNHLKGWPWQWGDDKKLDPPQTEIVTRNVALLADKAKWNLRVELFEEHLSELPEDERAEIRNEFYIRFDRAEIDTDALRKLVFPCAVTFTGATFSGNADFTEATFSGNADFDEATFSGNAFFVEATFSGNASFFEATFSGDAYFTGATFSGDASFNKATFSGNASFVEATFSGNAYFFEATFSGDAEFSAARFSGEASFRKATFQGDFRLTNLSTSSTTMSAPDMVVDGNFYVTSHFRGPVDWQRLEVKGTTTFSRSRFDEVPDLRDAMFERPPEVADMQVPPPKLERKKWWQFARAVKNDEVIKFRKLKAMALAANDHEKDGEFFAYEMLAKRGVESKTAGGLFVNTLYHILGDYGQSFLRPLIAMMFSFIGFAIGYSMIIGRLGTFWDRTEFVFLHSLRNVVPLFTSLFKFSSRPKIYESGYDLFFKTVTDKAHNVDVDCVLMVGFVQQFIGIILLFLFLLGLRNRFRLK